MQYQAVHTTPEISDTWIAGVLLHLRFMIRGIRGPVNRAIYTSFYYYKLICTIIMVVLHTCMYLYIHVFASINCDEWCQNDSEGLYKYILVYTSISRFIHEYSSITEYVMVHNCIKQYMAISENVHSLWI
jgi:hypothetical protein